MAKNTIDRVRNRLLMSSADSVTSGAAGEAAAIVMFESRKLMWMRVDQSPASYSSELLTNGAKRPDFLAYIDGDPLFMDVKTYTPSSPSAGQFRFSLEEAEWQRLLKTEKITGIPVGVLFWDKGHYGRYRYALAALNAFTQELRGAEPWRNFDMPEGDFLTLKPGP